MGSVIKDFGIQPILLIAQVVNFLVLLFILKKFLYKPILKVLEERKQKIAQSLKNAEEIEKKLLKTEEDREKKLREVAKQAQNIVGEATMAADSIIKQAHEKTKIDIEVMFKKGREALKVERERMQQELKEELAEIVGMALQKISGKTFSSRDQKEMVKKTIQNI